MTYDMQRGLRWRRALRPRALCYTLAVILTLVLVTPALGSGSPVEAIRLGLTPIGEAGSYFQVKMQPGEVRQFTVELGNFGARDAVAWTYPADVYTLANGGMGVRLADEPQTGATTWLRYPAETLTIPAGSGHLKTFAVAVPDNTSPGEYLSSIVIQDITAAGDAADSGVTLQRVSRQAIAVAVTIPGPQSPALTIGNATHQVVAGRSIVAVEVANPGNVRLKPTGDFALLTADEQELTRFPVSMSSVYAGTTTTTEIPFANRLEPGAYQFTLTLTDPAHNIVQTATGTVHVDADEPSTTAAGTTPNAAAIEQPAPPRATIDPGSDGPTLALVLTVVLLVAAAVSALVVHHYRTGPVTGVPPAPRARPRPASIRMLLPPGRQHRDR
jgi:hypothetical protein